MHSDELTVHKLFQDRRQFMVPFYQRHYVWTKGGQWEQLWEDIREKAENRVLGGQHHPHFLGAIVLDPQSREGLIGVDTLHIIDGQQRLTTLQYVLKAAIISLNAASAKQHASLLESYLSNSNPDTMRYPEVESFKVWPTFRDRDEYRRAMQASDRQDLKKRFPASFTQSGTLKVRGIVHPPALAALWFFSDEFAKWVNQGGGEQIQKRCEALSSAILWDLMVVSITLGSNDDAQVIFETLNGRGAKLLATDLIRNFIFMRADREVSDAKALYVSLWSGFEHDYWRTEQRRGRCNKPRLEWFIQATLQTELRDEIDLGRLYAEYRRYVFGGNSVKTAETQLTTLSTYASHYRQLVDQTGDTPIAYFGRRIACFDITTLHPLALFISVAQISDETKTGMFNIILSYIVRRTVCGLTTKNYNNIFFSVLRTLAQSSVSTEQLKETFRAMKGDASRWPGDEEFKNACTNAPFYPGCLDAPRMRGILVELEWKLRHTTRAEDTFGEKLDHLDIDHILPQSWFEHWPLADGSKASQSEVSAVQFKQRSAIPLDVREQSIALRQSRIATLGNLTLLNLSVNREAKHKDFTVKKALLLANTNLRLNIELLKYDDWSESRIKNRAEQLANEALRIWPGIGDVP
jgi:hypothetical protein